LRTALCCGATAGLALDPAWGRVNFSCRRARNHRQAVGQVAWAFSQSTRGRSKNENWSRTSARARRGMASANEKKEKRKKRTFFRWHLKNWVRPFAVDWSKMVLISFSPITHFFRLRFSSFPSSFVHADHNRFWTRDKNDRRSTLPKN
jgi:hypothetical protein